ncbi:MAG: N-acetyl sugar amidotransferase [Actinomycetota bacterium]
MSASPYQICKRCIIDTTVPRARFDAEGICSYCHEQDMLDQIYPLTPQGQARFEAMLERIRRDGHGKPYDCVIGISGGRDSTYTLLKAKEWGLRPLAVHFNDGFGNPKAGENMRRTTDILKVPMRTITSDWRESKDLRIACLKASVPDLNLGCDIGVACALFGVATAENLGYVVIGQSFRTEGIAPLEWNYLDGRYLRAIVDQFGTVPLRPWKPADPGYNLGFKELAYYTLWRRIKTVMPLYHVPYVRKDVDTIISEQVGWQNTGAHYFDDLYQSLMFYVHRVKHGIDRRRYNYSALIRSGQMDRSEAIERLKEPYVIEDPDVIRLCIKRLGLTQDDFEAMMALPPKTFMDYPNNLALLRRAKPVIALLAALHLIPKPTYHKYCGEMAGAAP